MANKQMMILGYKEAKNLLTKTELKFWSDITGDYSKKRNKSLVLIPVNKQGNLVPKKMIGSSYPNKKSVKRFKKIMLSDNTVLKGYRITS